MRIQVEGFREAGFGGFYLHSRDGLITGFLGDEWWANIDAAVAAGEKTGLNAFFYDEDKWPSGYAGGIIPRMNDAFRARCLARISKQTSIPEGSLVLTSDSLYRYLEYPAKMGNPKFNGTCYVDLMNPDMVKAFIDVAYKPYFERYKKDGNDLAPAVFSDEPHIHARYFDPGTPHLGLFSYSPAVRERFKKMFGYDFVTKIDLLFEEKENWREVRLQYHQAVAVQFEESFTKQIAAYCEKNGFAYTGHFLAEDVLEKIRDRAGNTMLHYRNMHQPGIDLLGLGFEDKLYTARALSSVANQYRIPRRLSELFGISGQNMNFEDRKWLAGWHTVNGINHLCPHLTLYSMKGLRKRDYPPTFSYHQPYFKQNKIIEDYLGRISYAASIGEYAPQILVISPLESEYIRGEGEDGFSKPVLDVLETLQKAHYDYDLGDEQILQDTARVGKGCFRVGAMEYDAVLLPDMTEMRVSTAQLLLRFHQQGGTIVYTHRLPDFFDGKQNDALSDKLKSSCIFLPVSKLGNQLPQFIPPNVRIRDDDGEVWSHVRKVEGGSLIQLFNTSRKESKRFHLSSGLIDETTVLWDPSKVVCCGFDRAEGKPLEIEIDPSSVVWLTSGSLSTDARQLIPYTHSADRKKILVLDMKWEGRRLSANSYTLDFARYSIDNGKNFSEEEPVIGISERLDRDRYSGNLILRYDFVVRDLPRQASVSVEQPEMYSSITINGSPVLFNRDSFFIDHGFPSGDVSRMLVKGENRVELQVDFHYKNDKSPLAAERYGTEIESIYLAGDFALQANEVESTMQSDRNRSCSFHERPVHGLCSFSVTREEKEFRGDLTLEGYPFYAGDFELKQKFNLGELVPGARYFLEFPDCEAITIDATLNGRSAGIVAWSPYHLDITRFVQPGMNEVKLILTNSLRNLMGPHHQQRAELIRVGPYSFSGTGGFPDPRGDSDWFDRRVARESLRLWTDSYYCIPFGFLKPPFISIGSN